MQLSSMVSTVIRLILNFSTFQNETTGVNLWSLFVGQPFQEYSMAWRVSVWSFSGENFEHSRDTLMCRMCGGMVNFPTICGLGLFC